MKDPKESKKILTEQEKTENSREPPKYTRSSQPLPTLPSFTVAAEILSFFDFKPGVRRLLFKMSRTTRAYESGHRVLLAAFLRDQPPPTLSAYFGSPDNPLKKRCRHFEWPKCKDIDQMTDEQRGNLKL